MLWIDVHDPRVNAESIFLAETPPDYAPGRHIEEFQMSLLRFAAQGKSIAHFGQELAGNIREMLSALLKETLSSPSAPRTSKLALTWWWHELDEQLQQMEKADDLRVSRKEFSELKLGPDFTGHLRPPNILQKILASSPSGVFGDFLSEPDGSDLRDKVRQIAHLLLFLGFARDRDLGKVSYSPKIGQ